MSQAGPHTDYRAALEANLADLRALCARENRRRQAQDDARALQLRLYREIGVNSVGCALESADAAHEATLEAALDKAA